MRRIDSGRSASSAAFDFAHLPDLADANSPPSLPSSFTEADFMALFESSGEALIVIDRIGVIQKANGRGRELLRLKETDQRHIGLEDLVQGANLQPLEKFYDRRAAVEVFSAFDATLANGNRIRITLRSVLQVSGRLVLCLEELRVFPPAEAASPQIQLKVLQTEKMAALGRFVSGVAHELNNPLTSIMGYAQLLLSRGLSQSQHSEANKVYQEAERARRIVKKLLYFARENQPERTRVDVNEIVERTLALRSYELKIENITVTCDLAPHLPLTMADPYQLQQVVLNLLLNAEQAMLEQRGQGNVWIRTHLFSRHGENHILLELSDDGPGIPSEIASRIFDPFFTTKPSGAGPGLGLSIVYGIIQQHGGEVTFESLPGVGTKFLIGLPVVSAAMEESVAPPEPFAGHSGVLQTGRILVVEDEPAVAQLIVDILREERHQIEATLDSQEGLTRLSRNHYDLVICDVRMPRFDGIAFYEALVRAGSPLKNRILFITGDVLARRTVEFLEPNGLPYLAKPFLVEELKIAVNQLLARDSKEAKENARPAEKSAQEEFAE
jgi:two-component system, NtrC family, sensor kinase